MELTRAAVRISGNEEAPVPYVGCAGPVSSRSSMLTTASLASTLIRKDSRRFFEIRISSQTRCARVVKLTHRTWARSCLSRPLVPKSPACKTCPAVDQIIGEHDVAALTPRSSHRPVAFPTGHDGLGVGGNSAAATSAGSEGARIVSRREGWKQSRRTGEVLAALERFRGIQRRAVGKKKVHRDASFSAAAQP